ncbi:cytochrome P450, family 46, subfamily A (cholesterol 24(S)-hydroxylase) [Pseudohyphozyma bogoriensis]|nr:cytochrome P450, family 46, subfamily A (cholesterol 24(S)-hydroxylase) [Pseudohyphozyma bogoriensis]
MSPISDVLALSPIPLHYLPLIAVVGTVGYVLYSCIVAPRLSPLYALPGPQSDSVLYGNLPTMLEEEPGKYLTRMSRVHGGAMYYKGILGESRLVFTDPTALNYVLVQHPYDFPKPPAVRGNLGRILGKGILFSEGEDHRRQKKLLTPAFSPSHLRHLAPTFFEQSYRLRDKWTELINERTVQTWSFKDEATDDAFRELAKEAAEPEAVLEVSYWLSKLTLEIIGLTGFGYSFGSFDSDEPTPLAKAFSGMASARSNGRITATQMFIGRTLGNLISHLPFLVYLPLKSIKRVRKGLETMESESTKIIKQAKRELMESGGESAREERKDLMTLLLKSNLTATDPKAQMSDAELMGQMTTFILAGHETTATSLTWLLWTLARHPEVQTKLRAEIREARAKALSEGKEEIDSDDLSSLEYLDAVTREILRFESPVSQTIRHAAKDDVVPLSEPIVDKTGKTISAVPVPAGTILFIPIVACNKNKKVFGDDADKFRPERWLEGKVGEKVQGHGLYSQLLTFLSGPRGCIGYKFALLEFKAIVSVLIDEFTFAERDLTGGPEVDRRSQIVTKPYLVGEADLGARMPLRIRVAKRDA